MGGGRNLRSNKKCIVEWAVCSMSFGHLYKGDRIVLTEDRRSTFRTHTLLGEGGGTPFR